MSAVNTIGESETSTEVSSTPNTPTPDTTTPSTSDVYPVFTTTSNEEEPGSVSTFPSFEAFLLFPLVVSIVFLRRLAKREL